MSGRRRLFSNTAWNLAGQLLPLAVGVLTLPWLIRLVGLERFGFISLVWVLVGYASIFDFGIGRALIRTVAAHLAAGDGRRAEASAHAALFYLTLFGVALAALLAPASVWLVTSALKLPAALVPEAVPATFMLAASLPFVMITTGLGGLLSAHQRFKALNVIRIALGMAGYLGPVLVALWSNRLDAVVAVVLALRVLGALMHAVVCARQCGWRPRLVLPTAEASRELFRLGGWIAVSNVLGPMLSYLDRLLLGVLVPMRSVAIYATPYDVVSKSMILPSSIIASLFPLASSVDRGSAHARRMLRDSVRLLFMLMVPVIFLFVTLARPGLESWLGHEIAEQGATVMQILAIGVLLNALAQGPAMLIQAAGEPRWMAKLHIVELPLFIAILWLLTARFGIVGTAIASCLRNSIDAAVVFWLAHRRVTFDAIDWRGARPPAALAVVLLGVGTWPATWPQALPVAMAGSLAFAGYAWTRLLSPSEREQLLALRGRGLDPR
jgi:O-antigen/teichoic acid export membrane protein